MKKVLITLICMILVFTVTIGCQNESESATTSEEKTIVRIGVSVPAADHGWTAGIAWWAKQAIALYPDIEWTLSTAQNPEEQIADIEDMLAKGIDGLVILATESAPLTPIAKKVSQEGIFIVNVDRGFLDDSIADIFIEGDNAALGRKAAEYVVEQLGSDGKVVIFEGIACTVNTIRTESALDVLKDAGIEVLGQQSANWNRQDALAVMETFLEKYPEIDAVIAMDDDMALGAIQAIKEAGRENEMFVTGAGGMKDVVKMINDNSQIMPATFTYPPSMIATGIHLATMILRDNQKDEVSKPISSHLVMDVDVVTADNADRFYFPDSIY